MHRSKYTIKSFSKRDTNSRLMFMSAGYIRAHCGSTLRRARAYFVGSGRTSLLMSSSSAVAWTLGLGRFAEKPCLSDLGRLRCRLVTAHTVCMDYGVSCGPVRVLCGLVGRVYCTATSNE